MPDRDLWILPPGERPDDTLEFDPISLPLRETRERPVEIKAQKFKMQTKLPWRVRLREWARRRQRTEVQANLEKLHQEYLEGQLLWGTDLRRDAVASESYSKFPPDLKANAKGANVRRIRPVERP